VKEGEAEPKIRVLLADDHPIVLAGLKNLLEPEFELVGTVEDGKALVREAERLRPQVIVADISMPLLNGIEAVRQIKQTNDRIKVVFLTMHPDVAYATMAFDAGASGYVLKRSASRELITAINEAMAGRTYVTPMIAGELMETYKKTPPGGNVFHKKLTTRQYEVLQLLAEGLSAKEIADKLYISPRTVETHKYNMMEELNLKTTADLIKFAIKHGIVSI
jgi:DNA-binding NarL/FixJ family response regulator